MGKPKAAQKSSAIRTKTVRPKGKPRGGSWKPGQSGNPKGAPKRGETGMAQGANESRAEKILQMLDLPVNWWL